MFSRSFHSTSSDQEGRTPTEVSGEGCRELVLRGPLEPYEVLERSLGIIQHLALAHGLGCTYGAAPAERARIGQGEAEPGAWGDPRNGLIGGDPVQLGLAVREMLRACEPRAGGTVAARELWVALDRFAATHLPLDLPCPPNFGKALMALRLLRLQMDRRQTAARPAAPVRVMAPRSWGQHLPWRWLAYGALAFAIPLGSETTVSVRMPSQTPAAESGVLRAAAISAPTFPNVWLVEQSGQAEIYSNGLRVENQMAISGERRSYRAIRRDTGELTGTLRLQPAGIVFHTTESDEAPFEPTQNRELKRIGESVLLYIRDRRAYHFLIDRFGRVHRIVRETDAANHAGHSVWSDSQWVYLDLNASFLGVAFEGRTQGDQAPVTQAQIHAAKVLTEMLRSKYHLDAGNCVTHAQVSVNPENMQIGYHTDWGKGFPFQALDLPNNYEQASPAMSLFGFDYDLGYLDATGAPLWNGLNRAQRQIDQSAARLGVTSEEYAMGLRKTYWLRYKALKASAEKQ